MYYIIYNINGYYEQPTITNKRISKIKRFKELHHLQVKHLKQQLEDKKTLADHTLIRNKFMETQRRNILVNELNRIENELGRGALPYHDKKVLESRKDELIKEIKNSVL